MSTQAVSTDRLDELRRVCDAYGADPARWPADHREKLSALFMSDEASAIRAETQALDGFLNAATAPRMAEDLERRITAAFAPPAPPNESIMGWFRSLWRAELALAGIGAVGIAAGMMTASAQPPLTPESEALAYFETDIALAPLDEEETATWDAD